MIGALVDSAKKGVLKYILLGFLALAGGGLVLMDVGGFFTGGISNHSVAVVGKEKVSLPEFDREFRRFAYTQNLSAEDAYRVGLANQYLQSKITQILIQKAARKSGLEISPDSLIDDIQLFIAPYINENTTPKEAFERVLRAQNMSEQDFISVLQNEKVTRILLAAAQAGVTVPGALAADYAKGASHTRSIESLKINTSKIPLETKPNDDDLQAYYEGIKDEFKTTEKRDLDLLVLSFDDFKKTVNISEDQKKQYYNDNIDLYTAPEQRKIEQTRVKDQTEALKIYELAKGGKTLKQATETVTGNLSGYSKPDKFEKTGLFDDIAEKVFTVKSGTLLEPIKSPFGYHVVKLISISEPKIKPYKEVKGDIESFLAADYVEEQFFDLSLAIEEALDAGQSVTDVAAQFDLKTSKISNLTPGSDQKIPSTISSPGKFMDVAFTTVSDETSSLVEDGNVYFAVTITNIVEPSFKPLQEVKDQLVKRYTSEQKREKAQSIAIELKNNIEAGENVKSLDTKPYLTRYVSKSLQRYDTPPSYLTASNIGRIFDADKGDVIFLNNKDGFVITKINDINTSTKTTSNKQIEQQGEILSRLMQNAVLEAYIQELQKRYSVRVNQGALEQLYTPENINY